MRAQQFFTNADEKNEFAATKAAMRSELTPDLIREYERGMRDCFNNMFGRAACNWQNLVASELLGRKITTIPNPFGPITIVNTWK